MIVEEKVHRYFATTVNLLTSAIDDETFNVMACEWTMNVSFDPLDIIVVVGRNNYTHHLIMESGEFGVNLASDTQAALSKLAGNVTGRQVQKFHDPLFQGQFYASRQIKAPMIRNCVLNAECIVERSIEVGRYTAFIGRAVVKQANSELKPLLYHQGRYFTLGEYIPKSGV
jgi:flavin reductase (DIM6/NTAB) family NADH-FMN oxidoreductase RutF